MEGIDGALDSEGVQIMEGEFLGLHLKWNVLGRKPHLLTQLVAGR